MRTAIIIPARMKSTRLPGKPLAILAERPMVLWVAELCAKAVPQKDVYIATDSQKIADLIKKNGFNAIMTSENALTGTDRVAEAAKHVDAEIIVNVQGDEPLLDPKDIQLVIQKKKELPHAVINAFKPMGDDEDPTSLTIPKALMNEDGKLVYISRAPVPSSKSEFIKNTKFNKQVCIYAFSKKHLSAFESFGRKSKLEFQEDIEILRFFELGVEIQMIETFGNSKAVDTEEDRLMVDKILTNKQKL
ncbi:3-deoxy-manno-octulosonate cytidylyltransferase [Planktomarina temperata]|nr:3-deoxy-manno-octulosonate cytidylyltransferase [Planktomarina temperata]